MERHKSCLLFDQLYRLTQILIPNFYEENTLPSCSSELDFL